MHSVPTWCGIFLSSAPSSSSSVSPLTFLRGTSSRLKALRLHLLQTTAPSYHSQNVIQAITQMQHICFEPKYFLVFDIKCWYNKKTICTLWWYVTTIAIIHSMMCIIFEYCIMYRWFCVCIYCTFKERSLLCWHTLAMSICGSPAWMETEDISHIFWVHHWILL